jgi:hypothetical protein
VRPSSRVARGSALVAGRACRALRIRSTSHLWHRRAELWFPFALSSSSRWAHTRSPAVMS